MARRTPPASTKQPANLSAEQMRAAIPKFQRRIEELKTFDVSTLTGFGDPRIGSLRQKIEATLVEVFGPDSIEYQRDIDATALDGDSAGKGVFSTLAAGS